MRKSKALLVGALVALVSGPSLAPAAELTKVRVLMNWFPQADQSGYWRAAADQSGKADGIEIEALPGGPKIQTIPQVAAGQAEFGVGNADDVLLARLQGAPIKAVFASLDYVPYTLVYHPESAIKSIADLSGHKVAVNIGFAYWEWVKKRYGLKNTHEIPVSGDLTAFRVDPDMVQQGYSILLPQRMTDAGIPNAQFTIAELGYRPYDVLFTTDEMLEKHPDVVKKALLAFRQGWGAVASGPDTTKDQILKANPLVSPTLHDNAIANIKANLLPKDPAKIGCMTKARWDELAGQLEEVNFLPKGFDSSKGYDLSLLPGC